MPWSITHEVLRDLWEVADHVRHPAHACGASLQVETQQVQVLHVSGRLEVAAQVHVKLQQPPRCQQLTTMQRCLVL